MATDNRSSTWRLPWPTARPVNWSRPHNRSPTTRIAVCSPNCGSSPAWAHAGRKRIIASVVRRTRAAWPLRQSRNGHARQTSRLSWIFAPFVDLRAFVDLRVLRALRGSVNPLKHIVEHEPRDATAQLLPYVARGPEMMPPKMRAFLTSSSAAEKLRNDRTTASIVSDSTEKCVRSPNSLASTKPAAPLPHEWPDGYSGCAGVVNSGDQLVSAVVAGFPSSPA